MIDRLRPSTDFISMKKDSSSCTTVEFFFFFQWTTINKRHPVVPSGKSVTMIIISRTRVGRDSARCRRSSDLSLNGLVRCFRSSINLVEKEDFQGEFFFSRYFKGDQIDLPCCVDRKDIYQIEWEINWRTILCFSYLCKTKKKEKMSDEVLLGT